MFLKIIDLIVCICLLIIVILLGNNLTNVMGGALALFVYVPIFYCISYYLNIAKVDVSILNILILLVFGINWIQGLDIARTFSKSSIIIPYLALVVSMLFCVYFIITNHLADFKNYDQNNNFGNLVNNYKATILKYLIFSFLYVLVICIVFLSFSDFPAVHSNIIKMIPLSFVFIVLPLTALTLKLNRRKSKKFGAIFNKIDFKFKDDLKFPQFYFILTGIVFVIGTLIELVRNEWMLWFESFVTINITLLMAWIVFIYRKKAKISIETINFADINSLFTQSSVIKLTITNIVCLSLLLCGLVIIIFILK